MPSLIEIIEISFTDGRTKTMRVSEWIEIGRLPGFIKANNIKLKLIDGLMHSKVTEQEFERLKKKEKP